MNRNPATLGMNGQPTDMKEPYFSTPEKARVTLREKVTQQTYQANELENLLKEVEGKLFGTWSPSSGQEPCENCENITSRVNDSVETLERCLKLAYSITERI